MIPPTTAIEPNEEATIADQLPTTEMPVRTEDMDWIPTAPGKSFRPLRFEHDGWSELMRLEPGSGVALHRHTGDVHAFNLSGTRRILGTDELLGPGDYVYEPAGTVDAWHAVGESPRRPYQGDRRGRVPRIRWSDCGDRGLGIPTGRLPRVVPAAQRSTSTSDPQPPRSRRARAPTRRWPAMSKIEISARDVRPTL